MDHKTRHSTCDINFARTNKIHQQIIDSIQNQKTTTINYGLFGGLSGQILYLLHATNHPDLVVNEQDLQDKFDLLQNNLGQIKNNLSLTSGLAGIGWLFEFINQLQDDEYDGKLYQFIDDLLINHLSVNDWSGEIELMHGLVGFSVYANKRQRKGQQIEFYTLFVNHLTKLSINFEDSSLSWQQPETSIFRQNKSRPFLQEFNLGLAHGVPGIIAALIPALTIASLRTQVSELLIKSCTWLLKQTINQNDKLSSKRSHFPCSNINTAPSRLAWCYGDLTIALTLARAGKALGRTSFIETAREISLHAANRDLNSSGVADTGICHGSTGLALVFKLLFVELGDDLLARASAKWACYTIERFEQQQLKGLALYDPISKSYLPNSSLLEGTAGIGLALLSLQNDDFTWVDCLLLG